jgi:hypothetical protein
MKTVKEIREQCMDELEQIGIVFDGNDGIRETLSKNNFEQLEFAENKQCVHESLDKFDVTANTLSFVKKYMDIKLTNPNFDSWMLESLINTNSLHLLNKKWLVASSKQGYSQVDNIYGSNDINKANKFISNLLIKYHTIVNITKEGKATERDFKIAE